MLTCCIGIVAPRNDSLGNLVQCFRNLEQHLWIVNQHGRFIAYDRNKPSKIFRLLSFIPVGLVLVAYVEWRVSDYHRI